MTELDWSEETSRAYAAYMEKNVKYDYRKWALRILADWASCSPGTTVVDVAGGPGFLLLELGNHLDRPRLVLADSSPTMLQLAIENGRKYSLLVETHLSQAEHLDLPDSCADAVVSKHYIRLSSSPELALHEMVRLLKPGGRIYIVDFDREAPFLRKWLLYLWIQLTAPAFIRSAFRDALHSGFSVSRMVTMLRGEGVHEVRVLYRGASYLVAGNRP